MAQIVYQNLQGKTVSVKNPTSADMDAFWDVWKARNGDAFRREFARQLRLSGSVFANIAGVNDG